MHGRHVLVLAMTADVDSDVRRRCRDAGMEGVLGKPTTLHELFLNLTAADFDQRC